MTGDPVPARRRRRRVVWRSGAGIPGAGEARPVPPAVEASATTVSPSDDLTADDPGDQAAPARRRRTDPSERTLRDLVGSGPSQLAPSRALRARDANRPTDADLAAAEQQVVIVRRHWTPPPPTS
jgi:hypothetical protein